MRNRGRCRSENMNVGFLFDNNKKCRQHINELKPWIKETNGTIIEVDFWDFVLPPKEKIYERDVCPDMFYRIMTKVEYKDFREDHIMDSNTHDKDSNHMRVFATEETVADEIERNKIKSGYVVSLKELCVVEDEDGFWCMCPICDFHVVDVSTIE
jgi:hypothetical protein